MKSLCITGLIQEDIDFIAQVLELAGMKSAKSANRYGASECETDSGISMSYWHEQVLKLPIVRYTDLAEEDEGYASPSSARELGLHATLEARPAGMRQEIGRLWEQLASDIFIRNMASDVWGWADTRSADLLPFWKGFDPQTRFVLVAVRPERFIAHLIEMSDEALDREVLLARWAQFHEAVLRFHRENPKNSVLVDMDDCVAQPGDLIKLCATQFGIELTPAHFPNVAREEFSDIARYLAAEICAGNESHQNFALELQASVTPIGERIDVLVPSKTHLIKRYRELKTQLQDQLLERSSQVIQLKADQAAYTPTVVARDKQAQETIKNLRQELEQVKNELNVQKAEAQKAKKLALDLESTKRQSFDKQKDLEKTKAELQQLANREKDIQRENHLLLAQLRQVQEQLERYFLKSQESDQKLEQLEARWNRMLAKYPNETLVESVEIVDVLLEEKPSAIKWRVRGLDLGSEFYEEIEFGSFIEAGVACLTFARGAGQNALHRWPAPENEDFLVVTTVGDEVTGPARARVLQALSATDWQLVRALVGLIAKELEEPQMLKLPYLSEAPKTAIPGRASKHGSAATAGFNAKAQARAFAELKRELSQLPPLVHFDGLRLGMSQEESEYEFLTFVFDKCWIGERFIPAFEFRFASVNIPAGSFGSNPRLEFHESKSKVGFEAWFEESTDDYGPKLELRFAKPTAMDLDVWNRMSPSDQDLVAALVAQLPIFIGHVKGKSGDSTASNSAGFLTRSIYRNWDDWLNLADEVHGILLAGTGRLDDPESLGVEVSQDGEGDLDESFGSAVQDVDFVGMSDADAKKPAKTPRLLVANKVTKTTGRSATKSVANSATKTVGQSAQTRKTSARTARRSTKVSA